MRVCFDCDTVQYFDKLERGYSARCICCKSCLLTHPKGGIDRPLALVIASLILFIIASSYPLMTINISGLSHTTTLLGAALGFIQENKPGLAVLVWLTVIMAPLLIMLLMFYVLAAVRFNLQLPLVRGALIWIGRLQPWGMLDVFLLGIIVAFIKLTTQSDIIFGISFYAFSALIIFYVGAVSSFQPYFVWESLEPPK